MEEMEAGSSSKKLTKHIVTKDFISDLPDPILVHILSLLPTIEAIQTVLLKRFGNLWRSIPVLHLDECMYHDCLNRSDHDRVTFTNIIHHVSNLHDSSVLDRLHLKLRVALSSHNPRVEATRRDLDKLIGYAINRKVKVLDLEFRGCRNVQVSEFYKLPDVLRSNYTTDLSLDTCDIGLCVNINLKALRVLSLHNILSLNGDVMEKILLGSPNLEELSVTDCYGLERLHSKNPNLKKMLIRLNAWESINLVIYCPHVLSLTLDGSIENATLSHASSLVDASVFFLYHFEGQDKPYVEVQRLLQEVCRCTNFYTDRLTILVMTVWNLRNVPYSSFQWKNVEIHIFKQKWYFVGVSWLLRSCRLSIEKLTMYIYPGYQYYFAYGVSNWMRAHDFDETTYWDLQNASFPNLESITIHGCITDPTVIQMVKFLVRSGPKLKKICLEFLPKELNTWNRSTFSSKQRLRLEQKLLTFPRASSEALMIHFF